MSSPATRLRRLLAPVAVTILVLVAVVITALRVTLFAFGREHSVAERWMSDALGLPVEVATLEARWSREGPTIVASGIGIHGAGPATPAEVLHVTRAEARLSLWTSLREARLALTGLTVEGLALTVARHADGTFGIEGFPSHHPAFVTWLLAQRDVELVGAALRFKDERGSIAPLRAEAVALHATAMDGAIVIRGAIPQLAPLDAALDFEAHLRRSADGVPHLADVRLDGSKIDLLAAGRALGFALPALASLRGDVRLWLSDDNGNGRIAFDAAALTFALADEPDAGAPPVAFRGAARLVDDDVLLNLSRVGIGSAAPETIDWRLRVARAPAGAMRLSADRIPIAALPLAVRALPPTSPVRQHLSGLGAGGELRRVRAGVREGAFYVAGTAVGIETRAQPGLAPGIAVSQGDLFMNASGAAVAFRDTRIVVDDPSRLSGPVEFDALNGTMMRGVTSDDASRQRVRLSGSANTLPFFFDGALEIEPGGRLLTDTEMRVGSGDVSWLHTLVPHGVLPPGAAHWVEQAFTSGVLKRASLQLHGPLWAFPFDHGEGSVSASLVVDDVELHYADGWPTAHSVTGEATLDGRRIRGTLTAARIADAPLREATFAIEDTFVHDAVLTVDGTVRATLSDVLQTLRESPLRQGADGPLSTLDVSDSFDIGLNLRLVLHHGGDRRVLGSVVFDGNTVRSIPSDLALEDLRGKFTFTREAWHGEGLNARFLDEPVTLDARGGIGDRDYESEYRLSANSTAARIVQFMARFTPPVHQWLADNDRLDALRGSVRWDATLTMPHRAGGATPPPKQLHVTSDLAGLAIDLPSPLGKKAADVRPLKVSAILDPTRARDNYVELGDDLHIGLHVEPRDDGSARLVRAEAAFGPDATVTLTRDGVFLHGRVASLPLEDWMHLPVTASAENRELPIAFDLDIDQLQAFGHAFPGTHAQGSRGPASWAIGVKGPRIAGDITVPRDLMHEQLALNLERMWLDEPTSDTNTTAADPRNVPAVVLACASFKYRDVDLGQASLATARVADGLEMQSLVFHAPRFQVQANGSWTLRDNAQHSEFAITVKAETLAAILQPFGYNTSAIADGRTLLEIEAAWPGTPGQFTLAGLDGNLHLKVEKGRFLDIEPGSGRLFGLLSLQTLPRRLSLDFADIFEKGFAFDEIEGNFELENGNAYTNNLYMDGPAARVEVTGRTGLVQHDYDQRAVVTPSLSRSIPVASALFGPAGIGVGAAIYLGQKLFKDIPAQVDRFLQREYAIKGSWDDPKVEKL